MTWLRYSWLLLCLLPACSRFDDQDYRRGEQALEAGNYAEAYCLWRPLAESGHAAAQYSLGWLYANGEGLKLDESEALRWWQNAAKQGHADAQFAVAKAYLNGEGTEEDPAQAAKWLSKAAGGGSEDAGIILRDLAGRDQEAAREQIRSLLTGNRWRELGGVRQVGKKPAEVRSGRGKRQKRIATLEPGSQVLELRNQSGWVDIGIPGSGLMGWVDGRLLEKK